MDDFKIMELRIKLKEDFHTTGLEKGSIIDVLKDIEGNFYIPATHIKGVVRTEAERLLEVGCRITDIDENDKIITCTNPEKAECPICRMFGSPNLEGKEFLVPKLRFLDFHSEENEVSTRTHVSIKRGTGSKTDEALYAEKTVPKDTEFTGYIMIRKIKEELKDKEEKLLKGAVYSASHYGFGSNRSRGLGGVEIVKYEEISREDFIKNLKNG